MVDFVRMIGDPTRLRILRLLLARELCVCQLVEVMKIPQPTVSQHLAKLRMMRLVNERKSAQWVYYSANRDAVEQGLVALQAFLLGGKEQSAELTEEWRRLESLSTCEELRVVRSSVSAHKGA